MKRKDIVPMVLAGAAMASAATAARIGENSSVKIIDLIDPNHGADDFAIELRWGRTREITAGARVPKSASIVYIGEDESWSDAPVVIAEENTVRFRTESNYHVVEYAFRIDNVTEGSLKGKLVDGRPAIEFETEQDIKIKVDYEERLNSLGVERYYFRGFNWFDQSNADMFLYYSDAFFDKPSTKYNPQLMTFALNLELAACTASDEVSKRSDSIKRLLSDIGCDKIYVNEVYGTSPNIRSTDVAVGSKMYNGYNLIFLILNGAHYTVEFAANMMVGGEGDHTGFSLSRDAGIDALKRFITEFGISGKTKLLIAGYSRTAAGANLLSRDVSDVIAKRSVKRRIGDIKLARKDVYGLCFETPLCGFYEEGMTPPDDPRYSNIWYTTNPDDPVTYVPTANYGFVRYGNRIILNPDHDETLNNEMLANVLAYVGKDAVSFYDMSKFKGVDGHSHMEDINVGFLEKFFDALGTREFYHDVVEDDFVNFVYVSRSNRAVMMDILWESGGFLNFIRDMFSHRNDYEGFVEALSPSVQRAASKYGYEEYSDSIVNSIFQIMAVIDRYCEGNIINFLKDGYLRTMAINPGRMFKAHYPTMTLSYLMLEDPNYPRPWIEESSEDADSASDLS